MMKDGIDIEEELANTNVTHKWEGLPEYDQSIGGRAYVSVRARSYRPPRRVEQCWRTQPTRPHLHHRQCARVWPRGSP